MTFDQWWATLETMEQRRADKEFTREAFAAGAASRDAEVAQWQKIIDEEAKDSALVIIERDQLRAHINMLRDAFQTFIDEHEECQDADEWMAELCSIEALHVAGEALDTIPEQSLFEYRNKVIEAFVNEFSRHVGGDGERRRKNFTRWSTR